MDVTAEFNDRGGKTGCTGKFEWAARLIADRKGCWSFILTLLLSSSTCSSHGGGGIHNFCHDDAETIIYLGAVNARAAAVLWTEVC